MTPIAEALESIMAENVGRGDGPLEVSSDVIRHHLIGVPERDEEE